MTDETQESRKPESKKVCLAFGPACCQDGEFMKVLGNSDFAIRALTRDPDPSKSQLLAVQGIEFVHAYLADIPNLKRALHGVYGAYGVQNMTGGLETEIEQATLVTGGRNISCFAWADDACSHADLSGIPV